MEKKEKIRHGYLVLLIVLFFALDMVTKYVLYDLELLRGFPLIGHVFNYGISRGMNLNSGITLAISCVALIAFVVFYVRKILPFWCMVLLSAGTLGNLVDRVVLGGVRDFVAIGNFPVFNVADVLLNVGIILFVGHELLHKKKDLIPQKESL